MIQITPSRSAAFDKLPHQVELLEVVKAAGVLIKLRKQNLLVSDLFYLCHRHQAGQVHSTLRNPLA